MLLPVIGIAVGLLVAFGPLSFLSAPTDFAAQSLVEAGYDGVGALLGLGGPAVAESPVTAVLQVLLSISMPGIVAVALVRASKAVGRSTQLITSLLLVGALSSFLFLDAGQALLLTLAAGAFAVMANFLKGGMLVIPMLALATVMGASYASGLWSGASPEVGRGAVELAMIAGPSSLELWRFALMGLGTAPFLYAAIAALGGSSGGDKKKD